MKAMLDTASIDTEREEACGSDGGLLSDSNFSGGEDEDDLSMSDVGSVEGEGVSGAGKDERMEEVMEAMDRELGATEVGKSFEKMKVGEPWSVTVVVVSSIGEFLSVAAHFLGFG